LVVVVESGRVAFVHPDLVAGEVARANILLSTRLARHNSNIHGRLGVFDQAIAQPQQLSLSPLAALGASGPGADVVPVFSFEILAGAEVEHVEEGWHVLHHDMHVRSQTILTHNTG